jgi:hypothetical protein
MSIKEFRNHQEAWESFSESQGWHKDAAERTKAKAIFLAGYIAGIWVFVQSDSYEEVLKDARSIQDTVKGKKTYVS